MLDRLADQEQSDGGGGRRRADLGPYAVELANRGWRDALRADPALALGLNVHDGDITNAPVAEGLGLPSRPLADVLA